MLDGVLAPLYQQWIVQSLLVTLALSGVAIVASTLLGLVLAFLRCMEVKAISVGVLLLGSLFRDTPLLLQMMFWYFAGPQLIPAEVMSWLGGGAAVSLWGMSLEWPTFEFLAGCWALTVYSAFFMAEDLRSGVLAVNTGQRDAAFALGMRSAQVLRFVVLPQAWKIALPALFGQYMNVVKNSSLAMAIGVAEMSNIAFKINDETGKTFVAFGVATVLYMGINIGISVWASVRLSKRLQGA